MAEVTLEYIAAQLERVLDGQRGHSAQLATLRSMMRRLEERFDEQSSATLDTMRRLRDLERTKE